MKIYFVYHAALGILTNFALTEPPTPAEMDEIRTALAAVHGRGHPKLNDPKHSAFREGHPLNGEPWDMRILEREVVSAGAILEGLKPKPKAADAEANTGESVAPKRVVSATGFVKNPE